MSLVAAAAIAAFGTAGSAQAAVTIGSNLANAPTLNAPGCAASPCSATNLNLPTSSQAPGGLTSPVNGTVTSWRALANQVVGVSLQVMRQLSGATFTGVATSAQATAVAVDTGQLPTSLPIKAGDSIGLNNQNERVIYANTTGASVAVWFMAPNGPLADGSTRPADMTANNEEVTVQATVEPTNTFTTAAAPVLNKKQGTATLTLNLPNAGNLDFSGTGANVAETAASKTVTAAGPIKFLIRATGKKLKKLKKKGKVTVNAVFTFTPNGGAASTQTIPVLLKKKLKKRS